MIYMTIDLSRDVQEERKRTNRLLSPFCKLWRDKCLAVSRTLFNVLTLIEHAQVANILSNDEQWRTENFTRFSSRSGYGREHDCKSCKRHACTLYNCDIASDRKNNWFLFDIMVIAAVVQFLSHTHLILKRCRWLAFWKHLRYKAGFLHDVVLARVKYVADVHE